MDHLWSFVSHDAKYPYIITLNYSAEAIRIGAIQTSTRLIGIDLTVSKIIDTLDWGYGKQGFVFRFAHYGPSRWEFFIDGAFQSNWNSAGHQLEKSIPRRIFWTAMMNIYPYSHEMAELDKYYRKSRWEEVQEQTEKFYSVLQIMRC